MTYAKPTSHFHRRLLRFPLPALIAHWLFQSMTYMDTSERLFKLALDLALTLLLRALLAFWLSTNAAWILALLLAHTANFLFNGHLWGILKHYGGCNSSYSSFAAHASGVLQRASRQQSIKVTVVCGSLARRAWSPSSDLDVRLVRQPGLKHGLLVGCFLLRERTAALLARFPLDVYMVDDEGSLPRFVADEPSIIIHPSPR